MNLTRPVVSPNGRILLIIGAGRVDLPEPFARASAFFQVENPLRYLA